MIYDQHPEQDLRFYGRSPVIFTIQRCAQIMDEVEIYCRIDPSQQMIFRYHLLQQHQIHLLLPFPLLFQQLTVDLYLSTLSMGWVL